MKNILETAVEIYELQEKFGKPIGRENYVELEFRVCHIFDIVEAMCFVHKQIGARTPLTIEAKTKEKLTRILNKHWGPCKGNLTREDVFEVFEIRIDR